MLAHAGLRPLWPVMLFAPWAGVAAAQIALADPSPQTHLTCPVAGPQDAEMLADRLIERGEYQQAAACYQAAGDMVHANLAFLKAAGPRGEDTARTLKAQQEAAKVLFTRVGNAFRGNH